MPTWLLRLWDSGAESAVVNRPEISKLYSLPLGRGYMLTSTISMKTIIHWLMVAFHKVWPNKSDTPLHRAMVLHEGPSKLHSRIEYR